MSDEDQRQHLISRSNACYHSVSPQPSNDTDLITHDIDSSSINVDAVRSVNYIPGHGGPGSDEDMSRDADNSFDDSSTISEIAYTVTESGQFVGIESSSIIQAVVFLEDAYYYRSINHKIDPRDLQLYRQYKSTAVNVFRYFIIFILHFLAFFEYPSSLTVTSDLRNQGERVELPCWLTQSIEFICLVALLLDNVTKMYLMSPRYFLQRKWEVLSMLVVSMSFIDWTVSFSFGCHEFIRFRRMFRPFFILQHSSLMKKIVNCLRRTVPEVASVLLLLFLHLFIFTLFGMLLFPSSNDSSHKNSTAEWASDNKTTSAEAPYFVDFLDSLISLLVLLTTANNPDVTLPAYSKNRFASIFFVVYLLIGLYCFMNMLLAVIYNQFRGYFLSSMQRDLLRRRLGVRASFEVLRRKQSVLSDGTFTPRSVIGIGVGGSVVKAVIEKSLLPQHVKDSIYQGLQGRLNRVLSVQQYQQLFYSLDKEFVHEQLPSIRWCQHPRWRRLQKIFLHHYFQYFGIFVSFINLIIIAIPLVSKNNSGIRENHAFYQNANFSFVIYYFLEQLVKVWAYGWRRYIRDKTNIFDALVTITLIIGEIYLAIMFGLPYLTKSRYYKNSSQSLWNIIRVVNIFIMARMLKIIPHIKAMSLVVTVLMDLMKNMKAFAGVLVVIFYAFAILGMELFHNAIDYKPEYVNRTFECGTYEQLNYWANNFDDFFAALVVLWDVMVVNNWQVFLYVYRDRTSPWSYLFFVVWWIMSVIIIMNLFTALIMENFIMKWDRRHQLHSHPSSDLSESLTVSVYLNNDVHAMFRDLLQEPADNELLVLLREHRYLMLDR